MTKTPIDRLATTTLLQRLEAAIHDATADIAVDAYVLLRELKRRARKGAKA